MEMAKKLINFRQNHHNDKTEFIYAVNAYFICILEIIIN